MMTVCLFDLLCGVVRMLARKGRHSCVQWVVLGVLVSGLLLAVFVLVTSVDEVMVELEAQTVPGVGVSKMFGQSRHKVSAVYEPLLPRAGRRTALDGVWQNVSDIRNKFYVYSAYYERRSELGRSIRVIGATRTYDSERVWCRLWYNTEPPQSVTVLAHIKIIRENWNLPYSACFVLCPLDEDMSVPQSVSIVRRLHSAPANQLLVMDNLLNAPELKRGRLALCIQPLHNYNRTLNLVEFLELYSLIGASHVHLYHANSDPAIECVLQEYAARGLVTYMPWDLELARQSGQIWVHGIHAALNDCLYRHMYRYSNVAIVDLDEFILPKEVDTLVELIDFLDANAGSERRIGSYNFLNAFFFLQYPDASTFHRKSLGSQLLTVTKTKRYAYLNSRDERSKYICKPELTVETGNHRVWEYVPGAGPEYVDPAMAASQHYRSYGESGIGDYSAAKTIEDKTSHRYKGRLTRGVRKAWEGIQERCGLPTLRAMLARR